MEANFNCKKSSTNSFSSPNSSFPPEKLARVKECIEQANEILRTLGNPFDPKNMVSLRLHLRDLRKESVKVTIECDGIKGEKSGTLLDAGKDFLVIEVDDRKVFILYRQICLIEHTGMSEFMPMEPELIEIDEQLRKQLIINFGGVVSKDPKLINLFFGIPLFLQLQFLLGKEVVVMVEGKNNQIAGTLIASKDNQIKIKTNNQTETVNIEQICFLQM